MTLTREIALDDDAPGTSQDNGLFECTRYFAATAIFLKLIPLWSIIRCDYVFVRSIGS